MKRFGFAAVVLLLMSGVVFADSLSMKIGENILRIYAGTQNSPTASTRELEQRIWMLERAVHQLQNQVYHINDLPPREPVREPAAKKYSCYLKTSLKGTFTGEGTSKNEAKGKALKACDEADGGIFCTERDLKCDD